jgi:hypothetical protein
VCIDALPRGGKVNSSWYEEGMEDCEQHNIDAKIREAEIVNAYCRRRSIVLEQVENIKFECQVER